LVSNLFEIMMGGGLSNVTLPCDAETLADGLKRRPPCMMGDGLGGCSIEASIGVGMETAGLYQSCQMVYFQTKNTKLAKFLRALH
jgi:hypothetical protein